MELFDIINLRGRESARPETAQMRQMDIFKSARIVALAFSNYHEDRSTINRTRFVQALEEQFSADDLYEQRLDYFLKFLPDGAQTPMKSQRKSTALWCYAVLLPLDQLDLRSVVPKMVDEYWDTREVWSLPQFSSHAFFQQLSDLCMPESLLIQSILGFAQFFARIDIKGVLTWAFYHRYDLSTLLRLKMALVNQHHPLSTVYCMTEMSVSYGPQFVPEALPLPSAEELRSVAELLPDLLYDFLFHEADRICNQPGLALLAQLLPELLASPCPSYDPERHQKYISRIAYSCHLDRLESFPVSVEGLLNVSSIVMGLGVWKWMTPQLELDKLADKCIEMLPLEAESSRDKVGFALRRPGLFVKLIRLSLDRGECPLILLSLHRCIVDFNQYEQWVPLLHQIRGYRSTVMKVFGEWAPFELMQCPEKHIDDRSDTFTLRYELHRRRYLPPDTINVVVNVLKQQMLPL